jgi:hypothetical protein
LDPLLAEIGRDGTGSDLDKAIKSGTSPWSRFTTYFGSGNTQ